LTVLITRPSAASSSTLVGVSSDAAWIVSANSSRVTLRCWALPRALRDSSRRVRRRNWRKNDSSVLEAFQTIGRQLLAARHVAKARATQGRIAVHPPTPTASPPSLT